MSDIDQSVTLAALVAERSSRAQLFERLHLDYCCGGSQSLAEACSPVDPVRRAHHLVVRPAPAVGTLPVAILGDELAPALGADRAAAQEAMCLQQRVRRPMALTPPRSPEVPLPARKLDRITIDRSRRSTSDRRRPTSPHRHELR